MPRGEPARALAHFYDEYRGVTAVFWSCGKQVIMNLTKLSDSDPELPLRVAVMGFAVSDVRFAEITKSDRGERMANQRFGNSVLKALVQGGAEPLMIASAPATTYPGNSRVWFGYRRYLNGTIDEVEVPFLNLTGIKHLTRLASMVVLGVPLVALSRAEVILVHGLHSPFLAAALMARGLLRTPAVLLATDPPNVLHEFDTPLSTALKRLDERVIRGLTRHFDGAVTVTAGLADNLVEGRPALVLEGIAWADEGATGGPPDVPTTAHLDSEGTNEGQRTPLAVYAGGVKDDYGVGLLLAAQRLSGGAFELEIYGRGPLDEDVRNEAAGNPGVRHMGLVTSAELANAYRRADVLVNPRPLDAWYFLDSFPSKVLEYLATGTPVVSTRLPGIPDEYWDYLTPCEPTPEGIYSAIMEAVAVPTGGKVESTARAEARREFVARHKAVAPQGRRLVKFLRRVVASTSQNQRCKRRRL